MNWSLLLSDLAGRVFGLIGLVATAVTVNASSIHWQIGSENFVLVAAISLFMFAITAIFLLPSLYDQMLRRCISVGPKVIFVVVTGIWIALVLVALSQGFKPPRGLYSQYLPQSIALYLMASLCLLFVVFVCPFGLAFRSSRRFFIDSGDFIEPERSAETSIENLRKRDIWDHLVELPLWLVLVFPCIVFLFGNTVPATGWNEWVSRNFWIALVTVGAFAILPAFLRTLVRPPHNKQNLMSTTSRALVLLVAIPLLGLFGLWTIRNSGAPITWNYLTENPVGTIDYNVVNTSESRRTRGCIFFSPLHAPDLIVLNCGLDSYSASRLKPGDIVRVTGELSWFGHSFDLIELESK